jgi:hypothetical protein
VSLAPPGGDQKSPSPEPVGGHAGEPCALSGLTALATATNLPALAQPPAAPSDRVALPLRAAPAAIDACAAWVARLQHGPPAFA